MIARTVLSGLALAALASPAFAHARLEQQSPLAGAVLSAPPAEVQLSFSEQLEPAFSGIAVTDPAGHSFAAAAPKVGGQAMVLKLKSLPPGRYHVEWHAVSVDTHRTMGGYDFTVKN